MKTISLGAVIQSATSVYTAIQFVDDDADRRARLKKIADLDPKVRTLVWLSLLYNGLTDQTEANHDAPSSYIGMRRWDDRILDALVDAGLRAKAGAFAAATLTRSVWGGGTIETLDLGLVFGRKAAFAADIDAFARANPTVAAWCERARATLPDDDRLRALIDMLGQIDAVNWQHEWPEPYRVLWLADVLDGEVGNGGVPQYFYNSSGDLAPAAVAAMRDLGLPTQAVAIERGIAMFRQPYPIDTEDRRTALEGPGSNGIEDRLDALTSVIDDGKIRPAMIAYAKQRQLLPH